MTDTYTAQSWFSELCDILGSQPTGADLRQCLGHRDASPSMSIKPGPGGVFKPKCFSRCTADEILAAARCSRSRMAKAPAVSPSEYIRMTGLKLDFPALVVKNGHPSARGFRLEAVHDYGRHLLLRWRSTGGHKELLWESKTPNGGTVPGLLGTPISALPLYREREVRQAVALGEPVLIVESESTVDTIRGLYATTWAGGADAVNVARLAEVLDGHSRLVVIPDPDEAGLRCLRRLERAGLAPHVIQTPEGKDARDLWRDLGSRRFGELVTAALGAERLVAA